MNEYKVADFAAATALGLQVAEDVSLVPVGPWILSETELVARMASWRGAAMEMFFAQFESTPEKTLGYLKAASIGQANRLLFVIVESGVITGHVGFSNVSDQTAELDNVMRGIRTERSSVMQLAINRLVDWGFDELGLSNVTLKVSSINDRAIALYERCGFVVTSSVGLRRVERDGETVLTECADSAANAPQRSLTMTRFR
ncbi:MAG: GNAT family N-acetyltransferase [Micrococcales bacterium]